MRRRKSGPTAWHVYARGARRLELFKDSEDFREFLRLLGLFAKSAGCLLWAYALMSNHYHLVVYCSSAQLSDLMRGVHHQYALYHNRKYSLSGHLLEGPYKSHPLKAPFMILRKIAYTLLNPFKAGLETEPGQYPWTSLADQRSTGPSPLPLDLKSLWAFLGVTPRVGSERFEMAFALEKAKPPGKRKDPLTAIEVQCQEFEWLLDHAREQSSLFPKEDPVIVACYWGSLVGLPPRAMARSLGLKRSAGLRAAIQTFRERLKEDPRLAASIPLL